MEMNTLTKNVAIRKIEDVIEIQRAKGSFSNKQVVFNLPSNASSATSTNVKNLESQLFREKQKFSHKKIKKYRHRSKPSKSPILDVLTWPSDSDITVLRMKFTKGDIKENVGRSIPGDGLHQPDSSSMVNLATLILQSQSPSKHSIPFEEYLLPLTSWERKQEYDSLEQKISDEDRNDIDSSVIPDQVRAHRPVCGQINGYYSSHDSDYSKNTKKSKVARFFRLYFCPCCTCLYKLEKMQEEPSACFTMPNEGITVF